MTDAIFTEEAGTLLPSLLAGSPWGEGLLHGGPPAGLLARAVEQHVPDPEMQVVRLTIDLLRPVPAAPLEVSARTVREGKRIHVAEVSLVARGVEVARASALLLRRSEVQAAQEGAPAAMPAGPEGLATTPLGRGEGGAMPIRSGFHTTVEARWASSPEEPGPNAAWIRVPVPFVAGEPLSPLVRIAAISDFVNAIGSAPWRGGPGFINADITLALHRDPAGEWIGLQVERAVETTGLGVSRAVLYDARGPVGAALQCILANERR